MVTQGKRKQHASKAPRARKKNKKENADTQGPHGISAPHIVLLLLRCAHVSEHALGEHPERCAYTHKDTPHTDTHTQWQERIEIVLGCW